ncbi:hypothetical protein ASE21_10835 [Flavobacterium sp. Root901]|uniref:hypothetical protein n=1 Tax=Flavobacterium sp. Root901 TaxID=1736605 RepID=UPI00070ED08D|nr:hypothetical protein [Flavobacterium sp. Root901]KRD10208.1 hypothetical protein ASE21_10835 [Flavobacterium sp. Root901]
MKNFKLQSIALMLLFFVALTSCSSDDSPNEDVVYKSAFATEVSGPLTGKVGQELSYAITFRVENGCGEFNQLTDVEFNKEPGYQVEAKYPKASCDRPDPENRVTIYKITTSKAGTYYLRIAKSETEYIVTKVVITD